MKDGIDGGSAHPYFGGVGHYETNNNISDITLLPDIERGMIAMEQPTTPSIFST